MSLRARFIASAALATASFLLAPSTSHPVRAIGTKLR
jgi:hypothetical protein